MKMKRSEVKINLDKIIKYCKAEHTFQKLVYGKKVKSGTMPKLTANTNILILMEYKEFCEELKKKGYTYEDFKKMRDNLPTRNRRAKQEELQFPT